MTSRHHHHGRLTGEPDGSARIRLRFTADEADRVEQQAEEDGRPLMDWIYHMLLGGD